MTDTVQEQTGDSEKVADSGEPSDTDSTPADEQSARPKEIGGRKGPDPTRYGDWEKNGRCIDF